MKVETASARPFEYLTKEIYELVSAHDLSHTPDPTKNINRFYMVRVTPVLFGEMLAVAQVRPSRITGHRAQAELREGTGPTEG